MPPDNFRRKIRRQLKKSPMATNVTIFINNDTSNPLAVECQISGEKEISWSWSIDKIISIEMMVSNKVGVDITKNILRDRRSEALILSQVSDEEDQIIEALEESIAHKRTA